VSLLLRVAACWANLSPMCKPFGVFGGLSLSAPGEGREALLRRSGYTVTSFHCSIIALRNHGSHHRTQFGSHEITVFLGKSGMGEVYPRARREAEARRCTSRRSSQAVDSVDETWDLERVRGNNVPV
jgi:hypothetical protein